MRLAVVGLHFGAAFVPIYLHHPDVERVALCDLDEALLHRIGDEFGIVDRFTRQGGHGGSHPHLAHEFVRSIVEERPPAIGALTAVDWTATGLCAHESAMRGGEPIALPDLRTPVG